MKVTKITNDEVSKNASGHHKIIGKSGRSTKNLSTHGNMLQSFIYPGKFLNETDSHFGNLREKRLCLFSFSTCFLLNFDHQVTVTKIANEEVSKNARGHQKLIGRSRSSYK